MPDLPSGTVTFLFTDIEGSTARWERQPEAMQAALARHDELVRAAIVEHGGHVVKTVGDAFHAAFRDARDAVNAAIDGQRRLQAEPWDEIGGLRVRMALHTGVTEQRDGDYYGPPMNRLARLLGIGHGGQILLSEATATLFREGPPAGAVLHDLGTHRLKDLSQPERVFQVSVPDLPGDFPRLASFDFHARNLPIQPTVLIGREHEIQALRALLAREDVRLVTLTGPGGTGKTRMGLQVAAEAVGSYDDGVVFVGLASIRDPGLVAATIAQTLGVHDLGNRPVMESLTAFLRDKQLLLLLDNFEQILPAAPLVADLLGASSELKILVTSRAALHLRGEHEFPVPPLSLPEPGRRSLAQELATFPAVALFVQRATDVRPDFALTDATAGCVAEICRRLDGLPLALELAAARVKLLTPQAMLARLEHRLPLLTGGARDLPERQRTLRDTISWTYDLLSEDEQALFRRLSVFVGGCTLEAVQAVCGQGAGPGLDVLDGVASLLDKSLVRLSDGPDGESRFAMLETVSEFATEQLGTSWEAGKLHRCHSEYFLKFAEAARPGLRGPDARIWLDRMEADHENLRAAIDWGESEGTSTGIDLATRVAKACAWFWMIRGHLVQGRLRVERLIARAPTGTPAHARALLVASGLAYFVGDGARALRLGEEGLAEWQTIGDQRHVALAFARIADAYGRMGQLDRARTMLNRSRALSGHLRDQDDLEYPLVFMEARAAWLAGDLESARDLSSQVVENGRADGDQHTTLGGLRYLALLAHRQGDIQQAASLQAEALRLADGLRDYACTMHALAGFAYVALEADDAKRAARLLAASGRLQELTGMSLTAYSHTGSFDESTELLRGRLGDNAFAAAWADGQGMSLQQAVAYALEDPL